MEKNNMTAVEWLENELVGLDTAFSYRTFNEKIKQAKQMEKEQHDAWNAFLEQEKTIGISDVKTIERIQWYYNQYYNETFLKLKT
jgi:hypothetical protein